MKVTYRWLQDMVALDRDAAELESALTMRGLAVDAVQRQADLYDCVVVAEVLGVEAHPHGAPLTVVTVTDGAARLGVVCGAPNVRVGGRYPLALAGSRLPGGRAVETVEIHGVASEGMLCSGRELELSADGAGLLEVEGAPPGTPLAKALDLEDVVFDLDVAHNRPDCLSVLGIAREVSALAGRPLRDARVTPREPGPPIDGQVSVEIEDMNDCPRYGARVLTHVTVGASPDWLVRRLFLVGQRPVNNIVDATNYVLLTFGQPIHAFDLARLRGARLAVRRARQGEGLRTLDGVERTLGPEILVIADADRPVAIAGVMGGEDTEVTEATGEVALESAFFAGSVVRRGSRALGMATEASVRFERGMDAEGVYPSLDAVAGLIAELAGGWVSKGRIERGRPSDEPVRLPFDPRSASVLVGAEIPAGEVRLHLEKLGFGWKAEGKRALVEVPSWRPDVRREADLIEEVARSHGYDRIPEREWNESGVSASRHPMQDVTARLRAVLLGFGWDEAVTTTLVSAEEAEMSEWLGPEAPPWAIRNASSRDESWLRRSVLPGLLRAVAHNLNRGAADVRLFEIGKVFTSRPGPLGAERVVLSAAATGARRGSHWSERPTPLDFYDIKGTLEGIVEALRIDSCQARCYHGAGFDGKASLEYVRGGERCAVAGEIAGPWRERYGIGQPVFGFSVDLARLAPGSKGHRVFREPSRFPSVRRDLAFVVPETLTHEQIARAISESGGDLVVQVRLFDVFSGGGLQAGMKSLAYAVTFQSASRTLTDAEVDAAEEAIVRHVAAALGATRRA